MLLELTLLLLLEFTGVSLMSHHNPMKRHQGFVKLFSQLQKLVC